jgi:hypothetical protein
MFSPPGTIHADGLHASICRLFDFTSFDFRPSTSLDPTRALRCGREALVGDVGESRSAHNHGTPILNPSSTNPNGLAAKVDLQGYTFDILAGSANISRIFRGRAALTMPISISSSPARHDRHRYRWPLLHFDGLLRQRQPYEPRQTLPKASPMQPDVGLIYRRHSRPERQRLPFRYRNPVERHLTATAMALGVDLNPETSIAVQGLAARGSALPQNARCSTTNGDKLSSPSVPVYVVDVAGPRRHPGPNLFNPANSMVYDPFNPPDHDWA